MCSSVDVDTRRRATLLIAIGLNWCILLIDWTRPITNLQLYLGIAAFCKSSLIDIISVWTPLTFDHCLTYSSCMALLSQRMEIALSVNISWMLGTT
jgi:hypothetical protein